MKLFYTYKHVRSNAENLKQVSIQMLNVVMLLQDASLGIEEFSQQEIHVII